MLYPAFTFGCGLEINALQTQAYLEPDVPNCTICDTPPTWQQAQIKCACPSLEWELPADLANDPPVQLPGFSTPILDGANWYDAQIPESGQFLGFMIESIQGLDSNFERSVTTKATGSGGGVLGAFRPKERVLKFQVLLFACNEPAMEYGFRYLTNQLAASGCDDCDLCDATIWTSCPELTSPVPTVEEVETGRWSLYNVGTVQSPKWLKPPVEGLSCYVRRVEFTMVSEFPWLYKCRRPCLEDEPLNPELPPADLCNVENWFCEPTTVCCRVEEELIIGETALIVEVFAASQELRNVQIKVTPDPFGFICDPASAPPNYVPNVEECLTITIPVIPSGFRFVLDAARERVTMIRPGDIVEDGTSYIQTEPGEAPTWPVVACGGYCVCIEATRCSPFLTDSTVSIYSVHREL